MELINLDINKIKDDICNKVIEDLVSDSATDKEKELLKEEFISKIKKNNLITNLNSNQIEIKSSEINKTMNEIYIDLLTSFGTLNTVSQSLSRYNVTCSGYTEYIKARINDIKDKFESCSNSLSFCNIPSFIIERFRNADRFDKNRKFHKDRYGQWIPSRCYVNYNPKEENITLPYISQDNSLRYDGKVATSTLTPYFQLGRGFLDLTTNETKIENAIDESDYSFWNETILSDAPFHMSFEKNKPEELLISSDYYYGIDNGAICDLEINFESLNTVNEITLDPYVKYPIRIVAIRYKLTDDEDEPLTELVTPDNKDETLKSVFTSGKVRYRFRDILCKKIYILFTQEHYIRDTYVYNPSDVYKNEMWFNSKNNKKNTEEDVIFKSRYLDREASSASWNNFNDKVVSSSDKEITDMIITSDSQNRKVIKYEYNYGFYNIGCFNNRFDRTGIYVSKQIKLDSNIKSVKIETDETHQLDSKGNKVTDIEYYITSNENPVATDWISILPTGVDVIDSELLFITGGTRAYLRFEAIEVLAIMKNGEALPYNSPEYHLEINERTGNIWCVLIYNYEIDSVYSIKYRPASGAGIDFGEKITTSMETFAGNGTNYYKLNNEPHLDRVNDYCNIKMVDISNTSTGEEVLIENVTDIMDAGISYKNFDYTSNKFQYYVNKNIIYFNRPIPGDYIVEISYKHLISSIRMKAILRRNSSKDGWLTPVLKEIKYNIETF